MNYTMILPLLLLGTSTILGHSIKKLEINNKTDADVYEIKEDAATNTVAFVNPKGEEPTLREIVYYHMIERPYKPHEGRIRYESEGGPEIDETMRPFTNSHGFPFLESVEKKFDDETKNELIEDTVEEEEVVIELPPEDDELYEVIYEEEYPEDVKIMKQEENKEIPTTVASEVFEQISTEASIEENTGIVDEKSVLEEDEIKTRSNPVTTFEEHLIEQTTQAVTVTESPTTTLVTEEPAFKKNAKTARKLLFDQVKERYYSKLNETQNTSSTVERRKREISMHIPEAPKLGELNYDSLPPYLRRLLISTEKPKARINSDSESDEEERLNDIKHRMHKLMSTLKTADSSEKPRTYGMNLTAGSGYVWNDMTDPGVHYQVEASESIEEEIKDITNPGVHYQVEASESIEEEIKEPDSTVKPKTISHDQDNNDERSNEHKPHEERHKEDHKNNHTHDDDDHEATNESMKDSLKNDSEDKTRKRNKHKENDDIMNQLMENDQFWKWLADWTSVYMDVLTDHIQEAVHQEVLDQIKAQSEEDKKDSKVPVEEQDIPKDVKENTLDKPEDRDSEKYDHEKTTSKPVTDKVKEKKESGSDNEDEKSDLDEEDLLRKRKDKKKKGENSTVKDKEIIKKETKKENKLKETAKVEAQNVYGNTIGVDKVTNIFIFYPNQDANKIIQDISMLNNSNNIPIDFKLNVPDKDKNSDITKTDASTNAPIEKTKEVLIDITTEKTTESSIDTKEKSKDEAILEVSAQETTTTKQPNLKITEKIEPKIDSSEVESTTEFEKQDLPKDKIEDTTEPNDLKNTKENEPTTKSSNVESTTESGIPDLPKDKIELNYNEPKNDKTKEEEVIEKTGESETEHIEKHQTTKTDNEATTEKHEST